METSKLVLAHDIEILLLIFVLGVYADGKIYVDGGNTVSTTTIYTEFS